MGLSKDPRGDSARLLTTTTRSRRLRPTLPAAARPAKPASAMALNRFPDTPVNSGGSAVALAIGNALATVRISGAAVAQPGGTDNPPTTAPWPMPAVTGEAATVDGSP